MARTRDLARPDAKAFLDELRALAPQLEYPVVGQDAIRQWFHAHGFRRRNGEPLSWGQLLDMQRRAGEPWGWHSPAIGVHRGRPVSSHLLLLRWAMVHAEKFGPPTTEHWRPAPRTLRARRSTRAAQSRPAS
jgi:hypothetical protein